ncbi:MFS transporter [Jiangella asiatica]|uniref:MFS transporter n=1 Tax=Jiangella asiatica TaxID=2530372 RepID=A0A4R5CQD5_9ACTN|nr:MFS transporter [Jiangella asiatica]TDE01031.1 MFS transporter [Jiangella asiatica]
MSASDTATPEAGPNPAHGSRRWLGLAVISLPTVLIALDNSVLFLAGPQLAADLRPGSAQMLWVLDIYGFMIAGFLVTMGGLADRIGPRRLMLMGAVGFGVASVLAAYSTSAEMLVVARALLGVAAATLMPSSLVMVRLLFVDPKERTLAIGVWTACFSGGTILGPVVGGVLLEWFWWGSVFLIGVPVMLLLLLLGPAVLPGVRDQGGGRLDPLSVVLSLGAILPFIYGLKQLAEEGLAAVPLAAIAIGVTLGVVFVRRQRRLESPVLDVGLFTTKAFSAALGVLLIAMAVLGGVYLYVTQYLQLVAELSPLWAGLWMVPAAGAEMIVAVLAPLIARRLRPAHVAAAGLLVTVAGLLVLTGVGGGAGLGLLVTGAVLIHVGVAPMMVLSTDIVVATAPPGKAGSAGSMLETSGEFGVAFGVAALGSVGTYVYRRQFADEVPAGVDAATAEAGQNTLATATVVADGLPADAAADFLAAARDAFAAGLQTVAGISAVIIAALAVVALTMLRKVPPSGHTDADDLS